MEETQDAELQHVSDERKINMKMKKHESIKQHPSEIAPYFMHPSEEVLKKTLECTTQFGVISGHFPMQVHHKSRNPLLQRRRINEDYATDSWFSTVTSYEGHNGAQAFLGIQSKFMSHYGFKTESEGPECLLDFFRKEGVPISILSDNSKMQTGKLWTEYLRRFWVNDKQIEPHRPHQNPFERELHIHKELLDKLFIATGCNPKAWFRASAHIAEIRNCTAVKSLNYRTPFEKREGHTPDITTLIQFQFWEVVYFKEEPKQFPDSGGSEGIGHWLGRASDMGDGMVHHVLIAGTETIINRSMIRSVHSHLPNIALEEKIQIEKDLTAKRKESKKGSPIFKESDVLPGHPN
ncbi:MAG: hypothetical protein AAF587_44660, partial [Bacteroidota bacterium]